MSEQGNTTTNVLLVFVLVIVVAFVVWFVVSQTGLTPQTNSGNDRGASLELNVDEDMLGGGSGNGGQ